MLVTISGTHGVGKTTICNLFKNRNPGWEFLPEILDTTIKPPADEKMRMLWFFNQYIERERFLKFERRTNIIADRDWIDCLVYAKGDVDYDIIERLYLNMNRTEPDLRVIVTLPEDEILARVNIRNRDLKEDWKEDDMDFIRSVNDGFLTYYNDFKDLKPIILLDGMLSPVDACRRLEREINKIMEAPRKIAVSRML